MIAEKHKLFFSFLSFSFLLHQHGISLDGLSDPSSMVAQAAQAIIDDFDSMMHASGDDGAS